MDSRPLNLAPRTIEVLLHGIARRLYIPTLAPRVVRINAFVDHPSGCYTCRWFGERVGFDVRCADPRAPHVRSLPEQGCAFWEREPGSDDE